MRHAWSPDENELKERYAVPRVRGHVRTPTLFAVGQAWLYRIELEERVSRTWSQGARQDAGPVRRRPGLASVQN